MRRFPKKRIFITGGGSGLGRSLALEFASRGWRVAVGDIHSTRAAKTSEMVCRAGGDPLDFHCDVTVPEDLESAANTLRKTWGGIDILVNNAGIAVVGEMDKIPLDKWEHILATNLKSVIYGCRTFVPHMAAQGGGHIVNVASNAGIASLPEMGPYNLTKAGVISLSETLRIELAARNIGVTVLAPTFFKTRLMESFYSPDDRQCRLANRFFDKSHCTANDVACRTWYAVRRNRFYVIPQFDGKLVWLAKRLAPELYFRILAFGYRRGWVDKLLEG
jgi:NAD(P)-dependent dehydrogenase (short-subunit alcohol dehydrogenase family)